MEYAEIIRQLKARANPQAIAGMARYGITPSRTYGVAIPHLRALAKKLGRDQILAEKLWAEDCRETRILAAMLAEPQKVSPELMEAWVKEFSYWEICDQVCMNLFEKTAFAYQKAKEWSKRKEEPVKRAGFVLMARLAVSDKKAEDKEFEQFFPLIEQEALDNRNLVKKAVNWALRQIGKRNPALNQKAIAEAKKIIKQEAKSASWIASDALRELTSRAVQARLSAKGKKQLAGGCL